MKKFNFRKIKAFTLVELLVVISIIGVLTTILMINFVGSRERARDAQKIQNLNAVKNALRMSYNDNQIYPVDFSDISDYFPNYSKISDSEDGYDGFEYHQENSGENFYIRIDLESGAGIDYGESQLNCEKDFLDEGVVYVICAN